MPYTAKRKVDKKRRTPVQARAIERVNVILDTALRLMSSPDHEKISTHLIAETAGVSVGSVYQFFPNIESIKIALIERLLDQYYERFDETLNANPDVSDLPTISEILVNATYDFYQAHPEVVTHIVSSSGSEEFFTVNQNLNQRVRNRMLAHFGDERFGLSEDELNRKISVVIAIGDMMTMLIFSSENKKDRLAFLKDWEQITAFYSGI